MPQLFRLLVLICAPMLLTACADEAPPAPQNPPFGFIQMAPTAPPADEDEGTPLSEAPMLHVWRPGYWSYDGYNFNWVEGTFIDKPNPTAVWSSDHWEQRLYGWVFVPGYWR